MTFSLLPTLDLMLDLYEKPRTIERFNAYLNALQGDTKGDLMMPIQGFNPMAKPHIVENITTLKAIGAEKIMTEAIEKLNHELQHEHPSEHFRVALNLADDLFGGWTNRFSTDYESKFNLNGLLSRRFCTPYVWTSELYTPDIIHRRTVEYALRSLYRLQNSRPRTLAEHIAQEDFVSRRADTLSYPAPDTERRPVTNPDSEHYAVILGHFYGPEALESLGLSTEALV